MKVAMLCSGLGHVNRGHEVFARHLFELVGDALDITLFKGGGAEAPRERVIANVPRASPLLAGVSAHASPRWVEVVREQERYRIEAETFAYAALLPLLEGAYDIVHCLESEVSNIVFDNRHLFAKPPKVLFSNGGAIPARDLPRCDFVQEHTHYNFRFSAREKAFVIPHGVDLRRFNPQVEAASRNELGVGSDMRLAISVGTICRNHKRMDHVIREMAMVPDIHLLIVGQESPESAAIKALGHELLRGRVTFMTVPHADLPRLYAAADLFVLGSLFETFGIVYIEAMAMGLPVVCTHHANQRSIVQEGVFVDMVKPGALAGAVRGLDRQALSTIGRSGTRIVEAHYDLSKLKQRYLDEYARMEGSPSTLPRWGLRDQLKSQARNLWRQMDDLRRGRAE